MAPTRPSLQRTMLAWFTSWSVALVILILKITCRIRLHDDPRPVLRSQGRGYVYAVLHAHQVASIVGAERGTGAMVSKSIDGQIIVPALRLMGCKPVRGSGIRPGKASKGGLLALDALADHVQSGYPAFLAVDGPSGPRGQVHRGIATLARRTNSVIVLMVAVPHRRWILTSAWDRLQIPKPFATINGYFGPVIQPHPDETNEQLRERVEMGLQQLERHYDELESRNNDSPFQSVQIQPS